MAADQGGWGWVDYGARSEAIFQFKVDIFSSIKEPGAGAVGAVHRKELAVEDQDHAEAVTDRGTDCAVCYCCWLTLNFHPSAK